MASVSEIFCLRLFLSLSLAARALTSNVTIVNTADHSVDELQSSWTHFPRSTSWMVQTLSSATGVPTPIFSTICDPSQSATSWLQSPLLIADGVNRYHIETTFSMRQCSSIPSLSQCVQYFNIYFVEATPGAAAPSLPPDVSSLKTAYPSNTVYADQYTQPNQQFLTNVVSHDVPVTTAGNGFYLLYQAPVVCVSLTSIRVYYSVCDAVEFQLMKLPQTKTGRTIEYPFPSVAPQCTQNAVWNSSLPAGPSAYSFLCVNNGIWVNSITQTPVNVSSTGLVLNARQFPLLCSCGAGFQPDASWTTCAPCATGTFKNEVGNSGCSACPPNSQTQLVASAYCGCLPNYFRASGESFSVACTGPPSAPLQLTYSGDKGNAVLTLSWTAPSVLGGRQDIFYTISYYDASVNQSNQGLFFPGQPITPTRVPSGLSYAFATNLTSVLISGLLSSHQYIFTIQSWNGVSQQALDANALPSNTATASVTIPAPLTCELDGVNFIAISGNEAIVSWSPSAGSTMASDCQKTLTSVSLFEVRIWTTTASTSSNRRRRQAAASPTLIAVQYAAPSSNSTLSLTVALPTATQGQYAVQTRALVGNQWTVIPPALVGLQPASDGVVTTPLSGLLVQPAASNNGWVVPVSISVTIAVLVVVAMISAFFIVHRKPNGPSKYAAEFHKFRRTGHDRSSSSSETSQSSDGANAAVVPNTGHRPAANVKPDCVGGSSGGCVCVHDSRDNAVPHNYISGLPDSNATMSTTLAPTTIYSQHSHQINSAGARVSHVESLSMPQVNGLTLHEACVCATNVYPGTHTNSAFRVYVDPHSYEDPNQLVRAFATELRVDSIVLEKVIGSGEFGDVCYGKLNVAMNGGRIRQRVVSSDSASTSTSTSNSTSITLAATIIPVAVKTLKAEHKTEKSRSDFLLEASILGQFEHPNILRLIGVATRAQPVMIVTEFMQNGSLDVFLRAHRATRSFSVRQRTEMLFDVANGMKYLSERGVIHRDLAARNILVDENLTCKVSDFGLSRKLHASTCKSNATTLPMSMTVDENVYRVRGGKIPVRWTAPEAIQYRTFNHACDVWSFGVLSWETLLFGERPFWNWSNHDALSAVNNGFRLPRLDDIPDVLYTMMLECWHIDPQERPTFTVLFDYLAELRKHDDSVFFEQVGGSSAVERTCLCRESWWAIQTIVSQHEANCERRGRRANEILLTDAEIEHLNQLSRQTCLSHWLHTLNLQRFAPDFEENAQVRTVEQLCVAIRDRGSLHSFGIALSGEYEDMIVGALQRWLQANGDSSSSCRSVQSSEPTPMASPTPMIQAQQPQLQTPMQMQTQTRTRTIVSDASANSSFV